MSGHISVSELSYAHPGGANLFFDVSFSVSPGEHVGLVGINGVGKSTLLRILAGELSPDDGECAVGGPLLFMPQNVGFDRPGETVRELLLRFASPVLTDAGRRVLAAERRLGEGDAEAGIELGASIGEWSDHGGYELEARWDAAVRRIVRSGLDDVGDRQVTELSGGERKQIVLDVLFASSGAVLLLDEPDNFLDVPAKRWLEDLIAESKKTVMMISHDRALLGVAVSKIITLESTGVWIHGGSYATYEEAREKRQQDLGDDLKRWKDEERRLFRYFKIMKQRAALNSRNAPKADAAETRWRRYVDVGPPPPPAPKQKVRIRLGGSDSARRVLSCRRLAIPALIRPFDFELRFGERVGLIGPNGSGKSHLMRVFAKDLDRFEGETLLGNRVVAGYFTQVNARTDFVGAGVLDVAGRLLGNEEAAMSALARYGLQAAARRPVDTLSGGQKARLEVLCLELEGSNFLLLDEPTDNLDIDSSEALEHALDGFEGTVLAVSHDRAFLRRMDHFLLLLYNGEMFDIADYDTAIGLLGREDTIRRTGAITPLTVE
jgi:ATPase subunit of ABC transporter with duplicated ATPase domains